MLNLGQLHLKSLFLMPSHVELLSSTRSGLTLFEVQQLAMDSTSRAVFEDQAKEKAGGKWLKHLLFAWTGRAVLCVRGHL